MNHRTVAIVGWILLNCVCGCGGGAIERASVKGTVTFDGDPVKDGMLELIPTGGTEGPSTGDVIKDGKFDIPKDRGPVPGKYRVQITATRSTGKVEVQGVAGSTGGLSGGGTVDKVEMFIPDIYNTKSTLTLNVESGTNEEDFELKSMK